MRFSSPQEVIEWATIAAACDYKHHIENGVSYNPYCTQGMRNDWDRGWYNLPPKPCEFTLEYDTGYQRGRAARLLWDAIHATERRVVEDCAVSPNRENVAGSTSS